MTVERTQEPSFANPDAVKGGRSSLFCSVHRFLSNILGTFYLQALTWDVGRGTGSFDEEGRQFIVSSISTKIWHVKEYTYQLLPEEEYGHFYSSEGLSLLS